MRRAADDYSGSEAVREVVVNLIEVILAAKTVHVDQASLDAVDAVQVNKVEDCCVLC